MAAAWQEGINSGRLRVPEGMPFLWNAHDFSSCNDTDTQVGGCLFQLGWAGPG